MKTSTTYFYSLSDLINPNCPIKAAYLGTKPKRFDPLITPNWELDKMIPIYPLAYACWMIENKATPTINQRK